MEQKKQEPIRDARQLGTAKMLVLGLQHMFAMFGSLHDALPICYNSCTYSCIGVFSESLRGVTDERSFGVGYTILCRLWHAYISSVYKV